MNFKFLFPTFRNRYLFVRQALQALSATQTFENALSLGTGEGDYDWMIAGFCRRITACDINVDDIAHARTLNRDVPNLQYETANALELHYPDSTFDLLISCEVLEHVGQPVQMTREIARVLRPGGYAIITFPSQDFPVTYDPVNRIWLSMRNPASREYLIPQGAYAFGHKYLISSTDFKQWTAEAGLELVAFSGLSGYLVGLLEIYWTGLLQRIFKKNAQNLRDDTVGGLKIRPGSTRDPVLVFIADFILGLDRHLFSWGETIGKGVVLHKKA
ncbi:MAG: SAM-dependent methyltransferase [Bacteroidetes bacterium]|nr:MAG: SAM-dependent methyltransferase [Bacteroidota bacterium]